MGVLREHILVGRDNALLYVGAEVQTLDTSLIYFKNEF